VIHRGQEQKHTIGLVESGNMIKLSSLINEAEVEQGHENDRDMVVGVAEILRMVDDMNNRKEIAEAMLRKFKSEDVIHDAAEFLTLCGIS
jgi:glutamate synthase domain-containing protein 2